MGGKGGKTSSTGLTPSLKNSRIKDPESPNEANKENIPPGSLRRSTRGDDAAKRALFSDKREATPRDEKRVTRSKSRQRGTTSSPQKTPRESVSPNKRSARKRAASPVDKSGAGEASPAKKESPGRPRRTASTDANTKMQQCNKALLSPVAPRAANRRMVLELDNADPDREVLQKTSTTTRGRPQKAEQKPARGNFSTAAQWRSRTPDEETDEEDSKPAAATTATPRRSTRQQSVGRDEKRREGRKREEEEESPSKVLDLNRMAIRTPSKGRAGASASGAAAASPARATRRTPSRTANASASPPPLSPHRGRTPTRAAAAAAATATPATMPKLQPYTPIAKVRIPPLVIPYAVPRVRLAKTGDGDWKSRTGKTPRTEGRPAPKLARVVPKKRDASYEPADVNVDESDEESEEEEEETESEQSEEEEEEERPRRGRSGARSGGRSCSRARAAAATPAARPKQRGGYRLEMEDDDDDTLDLSGAPANLAAALDRLAVYRCPRGTLLCREGECAQIREFVRAAIAPSGISQACYISGVPGTGKTASVMAMVKELAGAPKCPRFVFIRVNAMYFSDPKQVFSEILYEYDKQTGADKLRRVSGPAARKRLNALFECVDRSRPPVLMLVDELDQLSTKKQELIYDVFNWSAVEQSRCSIISIANTLDLPERMLNQRICSRLGMNRIVFQPYTHEEIEAIVCAKLGGGEEAESIIDAKVIEIAARKVAAISGDLRKATDILRQAIEAAIRKGEKTLSFEQVKDTIREASETLLVKAVRTLARHQRIVFEAAVDIVLSRDVVDFSVDETMVKYEATARLAHGLEPISYWGVQRILLQLSSMGLIKFANPNEEFFHRRLRLVPAVVDATSALKIVGAHRAARLLAAAPSTTVPAQ